jgi:hypothetical protein
VGGGGWRCVSAWVRVGGWGVEGGAGAGGMQRHVPGSKRLKTEQGQRAVLENRLPGM